MEKTDADPIDGIAHAVAIKQKNTTRNFFFKEKTAYEIYDYLRLLFACVGRTYCAKCGREVKKDTVDEVADAILALDAGTRLQVLFPLVRAGQRTPDKVERSTALPKSKSKSPPSREKHEKGGAPAIQLTEALKTRLVDLRKAGFNRLYQAGEVYEFSTPESLLDINFELPVFVLVDGLVVCPEARTRIVDAIETAYRESGEVVFEIPQPEIPESTDEATPTSKATDRNVRPTFSCSTLPLSHPFA